MSLNIVIDADVSSASQKISKFSYEVKKSFEGINTVVEKTSSGFQYGTKNITKSVDQFAKASRNSLTALSLTIQDLPFGFIGIQNNLPGIIQGFSQMSEEAKTGASVLSQLKGALIGPGGLFLAFSAVTAGVTFLVQKYGSLGAAVDALFSKQGSLILTQKQYNDAIAESSANYVVEAEKIRVLTKVILDSQQPQQKRLESYNEFKKVIPEVNGAIKDENALSAQGLKIINSLAEARITLLNLKIQEAGITAVLEENEKSLVKAVNDAAIANNKLAIAKDKSRKASNEVNNAALASGSYIKIESSKVALAQEEYDKLQAKVKELTNVKNTYIKQLDGNILKIAELNKISDDYGKTLSNQTNAEKKEEDRLKKLTEAQEKYRKGWEGIINAVEDLRKSRMESFNNAAEVKAAILQKQATENTKKATIEQEKYKKGVEGIVSALQQRDSLNMKDPFAVDSLQNFQVIADKLVNETLSLKVVDAIKSNFTEPLTNLFLEFAETGKITFKSFQETVLSTIKQLVSKLLASGIINLLSSIFLPGAGITGIGGVLTQTFGDVFGGLTNQRIAGPSFGGVGAGAFGLSGQVNVVLRGQDLVGALNRTNTTINRVG
jgi:hypothetical protein